MATGHHGQLVPIQGDHSDVPDPYNGYWNEHPYANDVQNLVKVAAFASQTKHDVSESTHQEPDHHTEDREKEYLRSIVVPGHQKRERGRREWLMAKQEEGKVTISEVGMKRITTANNPQRGAGFLLNSSSERMGFIRPESHTRRKSNSASHYLLRKRAANGTLILVTKRVRPAPNQVGKPRILLYPFATQTITQRSISSYAPSPFPGGEAPFSEE